MGTDSAEKSKHNPDADNLKSLLKKPPGKREAKRQSNRVVFNETKNEFFDADYIILIREECDFEEDDEDGVCTCYQHEMVRLTCCEPDCDCSAYEDQQERHPQSPKFAPPIEFVDAVTLSPPEGYKDMEMVEQEMAAIKKMAARRGGSGGGQSQQQRTAVCRECSANQEFETDKGDNSQPNSDINKPKIDLGETKDDEKEEEEKEKIDQSQQTTPTSPNNSDGQNYLLDSSSLEDDKPSEENSPLPSHGSPVAGILKGGKLWRQQSLENNALKVNEQITKVDSISDDESSTPRTVRFIEEEKKDSCKSSPETERQVEGKECSKEEDVGKPPGPEATEMTLTFKLGNHVLISNNSLKPNSAVRQLFPCTKPLAQEDHQQYLVTAESLRAFEEAKRSKLPQIIQSAGTTDSIKRVIERNTLRRSLLRYEPKSKKHVQKTDNSLVERIKQLTCDIDEISVEAEERVSPTGQEGNNTLDVSQDTNKTKDRNFSPSSSSTASSNSSSMSSTYRKITDLFGKREIPPDAATQAVSYEPKGVQTLPDIGGPYTEPQDKPPAKPTPIAESRKQFLAPLTACVGHPPPRDDHFYRPSHRLGATPSHGPGGGEYTLDDIEEALADEEGQKTAPDVLAGTPASESGDELLVFVQQDANRIERIKKKYEPDPKKDDDDEHDDYGFNRRPSVRGIKPRFGSTSEILQQIQNQIRTPAPPPHNTNAAWPYYSETGPNRDEECNRLQQVAPYQYAQEDGKARGYVPQYSYGPGTVQDNQYQNCGNQTCYQEVYKTHSAVIGVEIDCQTLPKNRNGRPLSPPPQEMSRNYHQTMVYIPYNHIEGYQPVITANAYQTNDYYRYSQNQVNKKYIEPVYQQKMQAEDPYCNSNVPTHKLLSKSHYSNNYQPLLVPASRSESPSMGNYAMARGTQTPAGCVTSCNYYQNPTSMTLRYRDSLLRPQYKQPDYVNKVNRHSFPSVRPRYYSPDSSEHYYVDEPESQHNGTTMNGYYNYYAANKESPVHSPTKTSRYIERGVPEGAASVSPQDSMSTASTNTSPTLGHSAKPMFYAMNV
ncbi:unnamed protein product [Phaedon cochleariae]|uniref:Uncharacterized protein n=1 Tax=Phaedon cochleariae TaxID=80249 RepID=A0A9P0GMS1_PHACE|nr:unnamed protein product [Phaedon cochleariae]